MPRMNYEREGGFNVDVVVVLMGLGVVIGILLSRAWPGIFETGDGRWTMGDL